MAGQFFILFYPCVKKFWSSMQNVKVVSAQDYHQQNIEAELVHLLYIQAKPAILGTLVVASCLVYALYKVIPDNLLFGWYGVMVAICASRYGLVKFFWRRKPSPEKSPVWKKYFICMAALAGISWSMVGTIMMPLSNVDQTFVAFAIAGVAAGAIPFYSASRLACLVFVVPLLLPFAVWEFFQGNRAQEVMALLTMFYLALLIIACLRTHKAIYDAVKLKFENDALLSSLTNAQIEMNTINNALQTEVNERKQIEQLLREREAQYRMVTDALPVLISYVDMDLHYRFINQAHADWFGKDIAEIAGKHVKALLGHTTFAIFQEYIAKLSLGKTINYETIMQFRRQEERYVSVTLIPNFKNKKMEGFFSLISDMTPRINYLATHDALTELPNRSLFNAKFSKAINRAQHVNTKLALLFLDLDHFKNINDTLGHNVGDQLLIKVAERIQRLLRDKDTLARLGGDEFTIILEDITHVEIMEVSNLICQAFAIPFNLLDQDIFITTSIGISVFPDDATDMTALLKNADMAAYRAKERGRNTFEFYTSELNEKFLKKILIEANLRQALDRQELTLYYQPIMDIGSHTITSVEALLRWKHPELGLIAPDDFIPVAEESGLIVPMSEWVLRNVCEQFAKWKVSADFPDNFRIAINLSARQFKAHNLTNLISSILAESGLSGECLTIELTESSIMQDVDHTTAVIRALKDIGVSISIDDFGTGYSSLNYLRRFPIDILKIDRSFITDIAEPATRSEDGAAIVTAIIALAHNLKIRVVAEGVENHYQYEFLRDKGCDAIQGFILSRPVPADEMRAFLNVFSVENYLKSR
jgi:diguanylate cyclase (GGDEF)-like protein/PAS domain S-box-containing protein